MASRKRSASGSPGIVYAKKSKPAPLPCENRVLLNERMEELEEGEDTEIQLKLQVQEMTKSARNKPHLVDSHNHRYRLDRRNDSVTHWRCVSKGCRKRIHTSNNDPTHTYFDHNNSVAPVGAIIHQSGPHNHLADARYAQRNEIFTFFAKTLITPSFELKIKKGR